jgi:pyridoxamine 5'-phosphate oxidase
MTQSAQNISEIRKEYTFKDLDITHVDASPLVQFSNWLTEAINAQVNEPTAMHLSTVDTDGRPSGRIVLLKGIENEKFVFYTNYLSRKGTQLAANTYACITFFWPELERQVRIEGRVKKVDSATSDAYFLSRPRGSRIGAIASPQSQQIEDRTVIEKRVDELLQEFDGKEVTRPEHWGGYMLEADYFEFWQGRASRLHDRVQYTAQADSSWKIGRLAP